MTNDDQANALADALLPKLLETLKKDVIPQLFEEQLGGFKKNAEKLLDEVKDRKRTPLEESAMLIAAFDAQDKQRAIDNALPDRNKRTSVSVISREDARDPQKYRAAKALAAERGVALQIGETETTVRQPHRLDGQSHLKTETQIFMTQEAMRDVQQYKRLRTLADKEGLHFVPLTDWHDLPNNVGETNGDA